MIRLKLEPSQTAVEISVSQPPLTFESHEVILTEVDKTIVATHSEIQSFLHFLNKWKATDLEDLKQTLSTYSGEKARYSIARELRCEKNTMDRLFKAFDFETIPTQWRP